MKANIEVNFIMVSNYVNTEILSESSDSTLNLSNA